MSEIQRLSEGFDFIEESCGYMPLDFSEAIETEILESEGGSSFRVIGKACGPFQPMGEMSRNNRLYESDHWDVQLENLQFQDRLKARDLLGTIGHHDKKVDDADIAAGIVSHIVTCLEKRLDKNGTPYLYGELEILDTPAGRNLKALYEGGANLYISSRGAGKLLPVPNETYKMVDKNSYFCETFDIVRRPGFLKAKPMFEQVQESEEVNESSNLEKVFDLDSKIAKVEKIRKESRDKVIAAEGKPELEVKKDKDRIAQADNLLKRLNKDREAAMNESEIVELKNQVEQLAKIIEKVVDDVYEPTKEEKSHESLDNFVKLMADTNISEEAFCDILEIIVGGRNA